MDTDRTRGHLIAIADHVISIRQDRARVGVELRQVFHLRHGERMMFRRPISVPPRSTRKSGNPRPRRMPSILSASLSLSRKMSRRLPRTLLTTARWSAANRIKSPSFAPVELFDCLRFFCFDEFCGGPFQAFGCYRQSSKTFRSKRLRGFGQLVHFACGTCPRCEGRQCT